MNKIVVGIDSSKPSAAALEWAVQEAKLRGSSLEIVVTWDYPVIATAAIAPVAIMRNSAHP